MGYPYEFKREDAERFALFVGIKARQRGDELVFQYCPYCRQKTTGKDRDKFAINLLTGQYNCFRSSCNAHGNMITLAKDFKFELSKDFENYYRPKKQYRTFKKPAEPIIRNRQQLPIWNPEEYHKRQRNDMRLQPSRIETTS